MMSCKNGSEKKHLLGVGISKELATYRKEQISDITYALSFDIPESREQAIPAHLKLDLQIHSLSQPLYLDFNEQQDHLLKLSVNGREEDIVHEKEHLIISPDGLKLGANTIEIDFLAGELSLNRNEDFLYTLLVPDRASTLFPCFDQPDLKANYQLTITAPKDWEVLCASKEESRVDKGDYVTHRFGKTDKMSTYLFSFVAGKFSVAKETLGKLDMRFLYREDNAEKVQASLAPIFDLHKQSVDFLENYTAYPFPFQKLDFAAIPIFQYGGMEHVGAIQYRESALFLDHTATESQKLSRAKLIAHETAHMWFGDLVTMEWFNDVWMKEVFANFMADKIINPAFPDINHDLLFVLNHYPAAYGEDRTKGTNPIRQQLANLKDAGSLYGGIIYDKAPIMMRQLELAIGKDKFREGISEYIKTYAYGNATWPDLIDILDTKTERDMKKWSDVWVNQSGRPVFEEHIAYDADNKVSKFEIEQSAEDGGDHLWPQTFDVAFVYPDSIHLLTVNIDGKVASLPEAKGLLKPNAIICNYDGLGYGVFPMDKEELIAILNIKDDVARGYAYINGYEKMLNGEIAPLAIFNLLKEGIKVEKNELIMRLVSNEIDNVFWTFLTDEQRIKEERSLEEELYAKLQSTLPPNIKKAIFNLYKGIAYSSQGRERLYQIWNKNTQIPNLKLNEDDYTAMAMDLAIYEHPKTNDILKTAQQAISNADKQKRFAFLLPSLSSDPNERSAFFQSFKQAKNREKEDWVLTALNNIHHPLRQKDAIKDLALSLELLQEIQQTGDIFFPKRWLSSSIGQYRSKEACQILQDFLSSHPDYNPILMKKILQATDNLSRVQAMASN
ncbi:M1 family metallopeptidase [Olivibacter sitiensis]|uniref:M1 family metallopeptidase n=1 Tax=Olivibacter sitiensis TaxID=376470 RepID=UPI001B7FB115|nr:M1 family aminopeptidase [Olivibacter sitiensis]